MADVDVGSVLVVPFGRQRLLGVVVDTAVSSQIPPSRLVEPIEALDVGVPPELVELGLAVAREYCSTPARGLSLVLPPGISIRPSSGSKVRGLTALEAEITDSGLRALDQQDVPLGQRQREVLLTLRRGKGLISELSGELGCDSSTFRRLESRGLVTITASSVRRTPVAAALPTSIGRPRLTQEQQQVLDALLPQLRGCEPTSHLLHGVTGSGKTEVYMQLAEEALRANRTAVVLVPEIALTPQTHARFSARFGDKVAIIHSKLSAGERYDEWIRLRRGEASICVGPRSAIFAPLRRIGLVVVDEEHDSSYKQEGDPRYDARRVAELRAEQSGALLVFGSATPRAESWLKLNRVTLPNRVDAKPLPTVELLDMRGTHTSLHARTREAIEDVRSREEKAVVLLNRRGWSSFICCRECGEFRSCLNCEVSLTLHRQHDGADRLVCHHCGYSEEPGTRCPSCGSVSLARFGSGTEKLEVELRDAFDPMPVFRLDSDTSSGKDSVVRLLESFDRTPSGVLLGTQMIAKGHDFADVTLGVVLNADATLRFPDFRSEERTFSLIAQLAGRSGRGREDGRVLVQTLTPEATSIQFAAAHDASGFLDRELDRRKLMSYPPYGELARIVCLAESQELADRAAQACAGGLNEPLLSVLGPAPLFRLKGLYRSQLLIKASDRDLLVESLGGAVASASKSKQHRKVRFSVDVDPQ